MCDWWSSPPLGRDHQYGRRPISGVEVVHRARRWHRRWELSTGTCGTIPLRAADARA
jgi:hypothetical protein